MNTSYLFLNLISWRLRLTFFIMGLTAVIHFVSAVSSAQEREMNPSYLEKLFNSIVQDDMRSFNQLMADASKPTSSFQYNGKRRHIYDRINGGSRQPLVEAARQGNADMVRALLEAGADVNAQDSQGETALHKAALFGYSRVVKLLVEKGASLQIKNNDDIVPDMKSMRDQYTDGKRPPDRSSKVLPHRHGKYAEDRRDTMTEYLLANAISAAAQEASTECEVRTAHECSYASVYARLVDNHLCSVLATCDITCKDGRRMSNAQVNGFCRPSQHTFGRGAADGDVWAECKMKALECIQDKHKENGPPDYYKGRWPWSSRPEQLRGKAGKTG